MSNTIRQHVRPFIATMAVALLGFGVLVLGPATHADAATESQLFDSTSSI